MTGAAEIAGRTRRSHRLMRWGGAVGLAGAALGVIVGDSPLADGVLAFFFAMLVATTLSPVRARPRVRGAVGWTAAAAALAALVVQIP